MTKPYFGLTRTAYLQQLCYKWGEFGVSWNFMTEEGETGFTKKRSVLLLWEEEHNRLEKVMHREAMPIEIFIEIDDIGATADAKLLLTQEHCNRLRLEYAIYQSRKGYHVSVLDKYKRTSRKELITLCQSDQAFTSHKATWSLEWSEHWKQKGFFINIIYHTPNYPEMLLGDIPLSN